MEASRLCGLKLASRRVGHQTSSRDAANDTCPCCRCMQGVEDDLSYHHAVAATHGVECTSEPLPHHRRDSIVRDVPTPSTRRVPRAGAAALNTSSRRGRFDRAGAARRGRRRTGDTSLSGRRRRAPQPVASATCCPRGSLGRTRLDAVRISRCLWTCPITNRGVRLDLTFFLTLVRDGFTEVFFCSLGVAQEAARGGEGQFGIGPPRSCAGDGAPVRRRTRPAPAST